MVKHVNVTLFCMILKIIQLIYTDINHVRLSKSRDEIFDLVLGQLLRQNINGIAELIHTFYCVLL